jgi:hypothetical protein
LIPFGPSSVSYWTLSFSVIVMPSFKPETCTNTSFPSSSGVIKPNHFVVLKNFTVPVAIVLLKKIIKAERLAQN